MKTKNFLINAMLTRRIRDWKKGGLIMLGLKKEEKKQERESRGSEGRGPPKKNKIKHTTGSRNEIFLRFGEKVGAGGRAR